MKLKFSKIEVILIFIYRLSLEAWSVSSLPIKV